jgi:hypothetical protein
LGQERSVKAEGGEKREFLGTNAKSSRSSVPCPGGSIFRLPVREIVRLRFKIVDSSGQIGHFLLQMYLNFPRLTPNPLRPRAFGGKNWGEKGNPE